MYKRQVDSQDAFISEIDRINPKEILIAEDSSVLKLLDQDSCIRKRNPWEYDFDTAERVLNNHFGTKNLTLLFGIVFLNHQFGSFLGAYLGGYFYDQFGSFDYAWYLAIVLSFVATALHLPIDEKPLATVNKTI